MNVKKEEERVEEKLRLDYLSKKAGAVDVIREHCFLSEG